MFCVVCYDISSDKNRTILFKTMKKYGLRIQLSVFEGDLTDSQVESMAGEVEGYVDPATDSLRIYMICSTCKGQARTFGKGEISDFPSAVVV